MRTIAIIPARGGSKRFPGKNVSLLNGKPLIAYSIEYALSHADLIDEVVVTTNDASVKEVASGYNLTIIDRPESLSGDNATTVSAMQHVLESSGSSFDHAVLFQPTNPLRPAGLFRKAFELYTKGEFDSLMTVTRNHQKFGTIEEGRFVPYNYKMGQRSQDLEPLYFENGLLYLSKCSLIKSGKILGDKNHPLITDHPFSWVDIDLAEDLDWAEYVLKKYDER